MSLKGFRTRLASFILGRNVDGSPIIQSEYGQTTESARLAAAMNMLADPEVKYRVENALAKQLGSLPKGIMEARRRYPEAYID